MTEILEGCEKFEKKFENQLAERDFYVGKTANVKDFGEITVIADEDDFPDGYETHKHPSACRGVKRRTKLHFEDIHHAYGQLRIGTKEGIDVAVGDAIGNAIVQTVTKRFIDSNLDTLVFTMAERNEHYDMYGNKWEETDPNGGLVLTKLAPGWMPKIGAQYKASGCKKHIYENSFTDEDYLLWRTSRNPKTVRIYAETKSAGGE